MILSTAPWRRAPGLVLRAPAVVVAVVLAAAVLALAAASGPLFVSSAGSAALSRQAREDCPERLLPGLRYRQYEGRLADRAGLDRTDALVRRAFAGAGLPDPYRVLSAPTYLDGIKDPVTLFSRPGVTDHVTVTGRVPGLGLLVSDLTAERLGLRLGGTVRVAGQPVRIVGLYTDLAGRELGGVGVPRYWCTWSGQILGTLEESAPPLMFTDPATLVRLAHRVVPPPGPTESPRDTVQAAWYAPTSVEDATLTRAAAVEAAQRRLPGAANDVDVEAAIATEPIGELPRAVVTATGQQSGIAGAVRPISLAGSVVALLLVAGAGAYWAERRRREVALLAARGAGPVALGVKAVLEMALPALAGAAGGWFAAQAVVAVFGPSARIEGSARVQAALAGGAGLVLGLVLLGVAAVARQRAAERRRGGRVVRALPWELALLAAAWLAYGRVRDGGGIVVAGRAVRISPLLLAYPLLALAGILVLAARLVGLTARRRRRPASLPVPAFLAARRLAGGGLVTLVLGTLVAVPAGILVYGAAVTRSAEESALGKAGIFIGADVAVATLAPPGATFDLGGHGALVSVASGVAPGPGGDLEIGVLGVGPDLAGRTYDHGLGYPVTDVLRQLGGDRAVLVGCDRCQVTGVRLRTTTVPVRVVDRRDVFPGMRQLRRPTLVVDRALLARVDPFAERVEEVWTSEEELPAVGDALRRAGVRAERQRVPGQFLDVTDLVPITWTFGYLQALAVLTGLVAVAGLLLHLGARQRAATVSYPMQRRMGLTRGTHLRSLGAELAALLGAGAAAGGAVGYAVAYSVHGLLDVNPAFPPPPPLVLPLAVVGGLAVAVVVLVLLAALATQRAADRINPADALRVAG